MGGKMDREAICGNGAVRWTGAQHRDKASALVDAADGDIRFQTVYGKSHSANQSAVGNTADGEGAVCGRVHVCFDEDVAVCA